MTMPQYCVDQAASVLGDLSGKKIVVLGASYRGKVKETAFSGVFPLFADVRDFFVIVSVSKSQRHKRFIILRNNYTSIRAYAF